MRSLKSSRSHQNHNSWSYRSEPLARRKAGLFLPARFAGVNKYSHTSGAYSAPAKPDTTGL